MNMKKANKELLIFGHYSIVSDTKKYFVILPQMHPKP
jgi:hypothetical protein